MGARSPGLNVNQHKDITISQWAYDLWGHPAQIEVDHDQERQALRVVVPPSQPEFAYTVNLWRGRKPKLPITPIRPDAQMLLGRYEAVTPYIFVHESRLDQSPEAQAARRLVLHPSKAQASPDSQQRAVPFEDNFNWQPYARLPKGIEATYARVRLGRFVLTGRAWQALGSPQRINLLIDPVRAVIRVRPDPAGAHGLNPHNRAKFPAGLQVATVAHIANSTPIGIYDPISLGRFEGVFKLRGSR